MFTIEVPLDEYHRLRQAANFLHYLEVCGVDSWDGYSQAQKLYDQQMNNEEEEEGGC